MADINENKNDVDPYEALAAALSGNTETAVNAKEVEPEFRARVAETTEPEQEEASNTDEQELSSENEGQNQILSRSTETAVNAKEVEPEFRARVAETAPAQSAPAQAQSAPAQAQSASSPAQSAPAQAQEMELRPTNISQAQAWFKVEGTVDKLDIHDLAGLQLAQKENPNNFTDAQRQQVKDLAWSKIQNIANRKDKLEPKDYAGFDSLLKNVPASKRMETSKELDTVKSAETRLYRAKNGVEDKSLGEKTKDGFDKAKNKGSKVLKQSKTGMKNAFNSGLKKLDKSIDSGFNKIDKGLDKMAGRINKFGKSVSAYAYKKKAKAFDFIKNNKLVRGTKKIIKSVKKGYKATVGFGKKVYAFGDKTVKSAKSGYKAVKNVFKKNLTDKEMAVKLSKGNLDKLTPAQIALAYNTLKDIDQKRDPHSKEVNALYAIKGFADRKMDAISADKSILTSGNAKQAAEWLNISQDVQDKVNHNQVKAKNERNNGVALALQSYGLDTKMTTANEKQEAITKTDANSDSQTQAVKQEMVNNSPDNIAQVQKNQKEVEIFSESPEVYEKMFQKDMPTVDIAEENKVKKNVNEENKVKKNGTEGDKADNKKAADKKALEQLSGRSNSSAPTNDINAEKNIVLDKVPTPEMKNPENTFVATPDMFKEPKAADKPMSQEQKADASKRGGPKKNLTKEQKMARKMARKLLSKSGRAQKPSKSTKSSPTPTRELNPNIKNLIQGGSRSA